MVNASPYLTGTSVSVLPGTLATTARLIMVPHVNATVGILVETMVIVKKMQLGIITVSVKEDSQVSTARQRSAPTSVRAIPAKTMAVAMC